VISVDRAEQVYLLGGFAGKSGGFEIGDRDYISALQLISQAGGFSPDARPERALILRPVLNTARRAEIPINLTKVLSTESNDYPLLPNDILFVPKKKATSPLVERIEQIGISTGISVLIFALVYSKL